MKYGFRPGTRITTIKPAVAVAELQRIHQQHGALQPSAVVEEAKPKDAPLHPAFEWRNKVAGQCWREHQARNLIRAVVVIEEDREPMPIYVHVRTAGNGAGEYHPINVVIKHPDLFNIAMQELQSKLAAAANAVSQLQAAAQKTGVPEDMETTEVISAAFSRVELAVDIFKRTDLARSGMVRQARNDLA